MPIFGLATSQARREAFGGPGIDFRGGYKLLYGGLPTCIEISQYLASESAKL